MSEQADRAFNAILDGSESGTIIARDDDTRIALLESNHPEGVIHWIAVPFEPVASTKGMLHEDKDASWLWSTTP